MSTKKDEIAKSFFKDVNPIQNEEALYDDSMNIDGKIQILDAIQEICRHKKKEKEKSSKTHVNKFLQNHFMPKDKEYRIKNCDELTYEFLKNEGDQFMNCLATFFATTATIKRGTNLLSMNSADGYFSAFKMFCFEKFSEKNAEQLPCFASMKWRGLRESIISIKTNQARKAGE